MTGNKNPKVKSHINDEWLQVTHTHIHTLTYMHVHTFTTLSLMYFIFHFMYQEVLIPGAELAGKSYISYTARGHGNSTGWENSAEVNPEQFEWRSLGYDMLGLAHFAGECVCFSLLKYSYMIL